MLLDTNRIYLMKLPETNFSISVLRHSHLRWSVIAQFFYVGAQVGVCGFFIWYVKEVANVNERTAAFLYGVFAMVGFMVDRFLGTFIARYILMRASYFLLMRQ